MQPQWKTCSHMDPRGTGSWAPPATCGWCRQITGRDSRHCLHCGGRLDLAWTSPLLTAGRWLLRLLLFSVALVGALCCLTVLFHVSPLVLLLPVLAVFFPRTSNGHRHPRQ